MNGGILVWVGLFVTPVLISSGQILFKITGMRVQEAGGVGLVRMVLDPYFFGGLVIYGLATLVWVSVLRHLSLGQAYPFMALSFLMVPLASMLFFQEALTIRYWIGAALVIGGMVVINT